MTNNNASFRNERLTFTAFFKMSKLNCLEIYSDE